MIRAVWVVVCLGMLQACSSDVFYVRSGKAVLPVDVRGNVDSGTVAVFVQGGPGLPAIDARVSGYVDWEERLEPTFAIAYYDQRGTGNALGDLTPDDISHRAQIDDLHAVLAAVEARTEPERVLLFSHSYGGFLSSAALVDGASVDGWIEVDGAASYDEALQVSTRRDFAERVATAKLAAGATDPLWAEIAQWCAAHPTVLPDTPDKDVLWEHLNAIYDATSREEPALGLGGVLRVLFASQYNLWDSHLQGNGVIQELFPEIRGMDLHDALSVVDVPSIHLSGEFDDIVPTEMSEILVGSLGSDQPHELVRIDDAGHNPFVDRPEVFGDAVLTFVEGLD
ncbi:MAG: alpha/beta hydrolase [Myxococcales bacterium]|nr:alpha/beta hydrolase [Myxococcales bacterium]